MPYKKDGKIKTLLRIDASSRVEGSHSREFADQIQQRWKQKYPEGDITVRDLTALAIPHIHNDTIAGFCTPKADRDEKFKKATELSDTLIGEIKRADALLLSVPMYNFSIPSALKAYIDQVTRPGETFTIGENGFFGLLGGKKAYLVLSYGAVFSNSEIAHLDFVEPYLKGLLGFLAITDIEVFKLEGSNADPEVFKQTRTAALKKNRFRLIARKNQVKRLQDANAQRTSFRCTEGCYTALFTKGVGNIPSRDFCPFRHVGNS